MSQDARRDEELSTQRRAQILALHYVDTSRIENKQLFKELLSVAEIANLRVIPLRADNNQIIFGVTNITSQQTMTNLRQRFLDQKVEFALISDTGFRDYMQLYDPPKKIVYQDISLNTAGSDELVERVSSVLEQVRADDMLAYLVSQAHQLDASDVHIETQKDYVRIRFRIDGILHPIARLEQEKYRALISAIASAGNVSTSSDEAQQGHISQHLTMADGREVDVNVRLETVPTINAMDVVMRLFNMDQSRYNLDRLGLSTAEREVVDGIISKPSGLVMVVGPTGSGKTTTLYSMLNTLNTDERKIITIEDPVEYQFEGITQISVASKTSHEYNFADKLRAVLRLDPDIVMVGEIRDMDTAKTALQASLTGHLVLTTFHASSASAALTRLADALEGADIFIGVSKAGLLTPVMIQSMAKDPIIFAMANPVPEIMPDEARAAGVAIIATGRSDFPNQVNNALAFPGIFRGALDNKVTAITDEHKVAAAEAIASLVVNPTSDCIIPSVLEPHLMETVASVIV